MQWQYQLCLLLEAYDLAGFVDGTVIAPAQFVTDSEGRSISNPAYLSFVKQSKLMVSWLVSTISGELLLKFVGSTTACQIVCGRVECQGGSS